ECDELVCKNPSTIDVCDNHSEIFSNSNNDDDISIYDDDFEDIEYVEASLLDPEIVSIEEENEETRSGNTTHADNSLPEYDSFCFEIEPDQERLINLVENDNSDSSNDPLLEEVDLFLSDNSIPPGIENVADDPEGDIQPPDDNFDLEPEVISAVMEDIDEPDEHFNPGGEIFVSTNNEDVDYFPFMFVIRIFLPYLILPEISPLFLSAESEDTIFDPEESNLFLDDNSIPSGIENVADEQEGDIRFLEELLIDDSILSHESFDINFKDNPSISRPPPEPPDDNFDLEPKVISAAMKDIDEPDEHFNPGGEIFVSTNNEDDYPPEIEVILCRIYVRFPRPSYPLIDFSLGTSISF
nr:hypothetical protein [Tanacetum cinerariifolium]